ncbi:MAG TPA: response regulator [Casimicrobiaceae bacterium]|nr:response regulator [Casimicrobiaceae bacterium]
MNSNYEMVDILLAEDSDADAEMTLRALRQSNIGNAVHRVRDGQEALDFLYRTGAYEGCTPARLLKLVLLDLKMPKVDGVEVLRKLRATEAFRTLPVVIMTSSNEERDVTQSYLLGANSYVVKPIDFSQFAKTVVEVGLYWIVTNRVPG